MDDEIGVLFVTEANVIGNIDDSRLRELKWIKRIWAKVNRRYRNKYIDIKPLKCRCRIRAEYNNQ